MSLCRFVPSAPPVTKEAVQRLSSILLDSEKVVVMTGAGISTESGIPDYRSKGVGLYARNGHRPITIQEFLASEANRRRYWSRNYVAWPRFNAAPANETHRRLADWEASDNRFHWLITQNVDGLHTIAGSERVTELHGCGRFVKCLVCHTRYPRNEVQAWMADLNREWTTAEVGELRPDGDVDVSDEATASFRLPTCPRCGPKSILKTDVVFFGDTVPLIDVNKSYEVLDEADAFLVLGSSLTVMSGLRFVYHAREKDIPVLIVNIGPTRGDDMATVKVEARCSEVIKML